MAEESKWETIDKGSYEDTKQMRYKHGHLVRYETWSLEGEFACTMVFVPDAYSQPLMEMEKP